MTLKGKFILTIVLSIVIPVSLLSVFGYFSIRSRMIDNEGQRLREVSTAALREVDKDFTSRSSELHLLVGLGGIVTSFEYGLFDPAVGILQEFAKSFNWYNELHLIDPKGNILAGTGAAGSASLKEAYREIAADKVQFGKPYLDDKTGRILLDICVPVYVSGKQMGLLVAEYSMEHLFTSIDAMFVVGEGQSEDGHIMLADKNGVVVYAPKFEREKGNIILQQNMAQAGMESVKLAIAGKRGYIEEKTEHGRKSLVGYVPATGGNMELSAITLHDIAGVLESVFGMLKSLSVLAVLLIFAGVLVAFVVGTQATNPILAVITGLFEAAGQVDGASDLMRRSSDGLARGAGEQAASLEEVAASLNETSSMVKQNADRATEASSLMDSNDEILRQAEQAMKELTATMNRISEVGAKTASIVKTIDEIAFQTNLLALNAAVEAARAGEAGAGFAVVADEVRNLALRATGAAKETGALIEGSLVEIGNGTLIAGKMDVSFRKVVESTEKINVIVKDIASVSSQQANAISEISKGMEQVDRIAQHNSDIATESATGAQELRIQSENLNACVLGLQRVVGGVRQQGDSKTTRQEREERGEEIY